MPSAGVTAAGEAQRRQRLRRSAFLWALIAVGFYAGFIVLTLLRGAP